MTALAVSVAKAADMCDLDQTTIRAAIARREIPAKKVGRKLLVPVDGLKAWIESLPDASPAEDD